MPPPAIAIHAAFGEPYTPALTFFSRPCEFVDSPLLSTRARPAAPALVFLCRFSRVPGNVILPLEVCEAVLNATKPPIPAATSATTMITGASHRLGLRTGGPYPGIPGGYAGCASQG